MPRNNEQHLKRTIVRNYPYFYHSSRLAVVNSSIYPRIAEITSNDEFVSNYLLPILVLYHVSHVSYSVVKGVEIRSYSVAPGWPGTHFVALAGFELAAILQSQLFECWNYKHEPPCQILTPSHFSFFILLCYVYVCLRG